MYWSTSLAACTRVAVVVPRSSASGPRTLQGTSLFLASLRAKRLKLSDSPVGRNSPSLSEPVPSSFSSSSPSSSLLSLLSLLALSLPEDTASSESCCAAASFRATSAAVRARSTSMTATLTASFSTLTPRAFSTARRTLLSFKSSMPSTGIAAFTASTSASLPVPLADSAGAGFSGSAGGSSVAPWPAMSSSRGSGGMASMALARALRVWH
mmetsp:Transcript_23559/g.66957  ORF Transcript_23559/g.66957 Transcript_23559/m.66957 type:complete len:211 (+) Transcript_23559:523-1155(+)